MKLKNFVKVVVFSVIGFVLMMLGSPISMLFGTYGALVHTAIGSLLCAPVYLVMCKKVKQRGAVSLFYLISGLIYAVMGFWLMFMIIIPCAIIAELVLIKEGSYDNNFKVGVSYVLSQIILALHGMIFLIVFGVQGLAEQFPKLFTVEFAQKAWDTFFNVTNLAIIIVVQVALSVLGIYIASIIYKKYFDSDRTNKKSKLGELDV